MSDLPSSKPWEVHPEIWKSEAAFWAYLRGGIRLIWSRYPAKLAWKKGKMFPPPAGYTGRAKTLGTCHYCQEMFPASKLEVDHVNQAGSLNSWESTGEFIRKLLDLNSEWVLACKPCHKIKSYAERTGMDFQDAFAEKKAIQYLKIHSKNEVLAYLQTFGYNANSLKNNQQRRAALVEVFRRKQ